MEGKKKFQPDRQLKLIDQAQRVLRYFHYTYPTEKTYYHQIDRFLKYYPFKIHCSGYNLVVSLAGYQLNGPTIHCHTCIYISV